MVERRVVIIDNELPKGALDYTVFELKSNYYTTIMEFKNYKSASEILERGWNRVLKHYVGGVC